MEMHEDSWQNHSLLLPLRFLVTLCESSMVLSLSSCHSHSHGAKWLSSQCHLSASASPANTFQSPNIWKREVDWSSLDEGIHPYSFSYGWGLLKPTSMGKAFLEKRNMGWQTTLRIVCYL